MSAKQLAAQMKAIIEDIKSKGTRRDLLRPPHFAS